MEHQVSLHLQDWTERLISAVSETNSFGIAIFLESGALLFVNSAMKKLCADFDASSLIHPTFEKLISLNNDETLIFSGFLTIGKMNNLNTSLETKIFRQDGKILIAGGFDVSNMISQNKTMHILNQKVTNLQRQLMQEKTELESTMQKLRETQQMLIHSEKMNALGQMIAGVAHEINNPISFVTNNLYELEKYTNEYINAYQEIELEIEKNASEELKTFVKKTKEKNEIDYLTEDINNIISESKSGVERVKKIVIDLRKFSRLDESEIKKIDLVENICSTLTIVQSELSKKNIQFKLESPDEVFMDCYPGQLNQALLNVLLNAIQAVNKDGKIVLIIKEVKRYIHIEVEDNGCGIKEEDMKKIFDPFFTTKPLGSGTGLGLSITYKIINDLHNGKIEVESEINKGTKIKLIIPKEIKNDRE